jgi:hypothetical protein
MQIFSEKIAVFMLKISIFSKPKTNLMKTQRGDFIHSQKIRSIEIIMRSKTKNLKS